MASDEEEEMTYEKEEMTYEKELASDVSKGIATELLLEVKRLNRVFSPFSQADMELLAEMMSVLEFQPNDPVCVKGEKATFFAIVLAGVFHAKVTDSMVFPLGKGMIVGEMSYFEGDKRNADVYAHTAGIMAVFTFHQMIELVNESPSLMAKMLTMLASSSIRKLHNQEDLDDDDDDDEEDEENDDKPKHELLFRKRFAARSKDTQKTLKSEQKKRQEAEHRAKNLEWTMQREVRILRKNLGAAESTIKVDKQTIKQKMQTIEALQKALDEAKEEHQRDMETQQALIDAAKARHSGAVSMQDTIRLENEAQIRKALAASQRQHEKAIVKMIQDNALNVKRHEQFQAELETKHQAEVYYFTEQQRNLEQQLATATKALNDPNLLRREEMVQKLAEQQKYYEEQVAKEKANVESLDEELSRTRSKLESFLKWKRNAMDQSNRMQAEKRRMRLDVQAGQDARQILASYKTILKYASINTFVSNFKQRKELTKLHANMLALIKSLYEQREVTDQIQLQSEIRVWIDNSKRLQKLPSAKLQCSDMIRSLTDAEEVLKCFVQQTNEVKEHWKATANRFFERNSVLKHDCMSMRDALKQSMADVNTLQQAANIRQKQVSVLSSRLVRSMEEGKSRDENIKKLNRKVAQTHIRAAGVMGTTRPSPYAVASQPTSQQPALSSLLGNRPQSSRSTRRSSSRQMGGARPTSSSGNPMWGVDTRRHEYNSRQQVQQWLSTDGSGVGSGGPLQGARGASMEFEGYGSGGGGYGGGGEGQWQQQPMPMPPPPQQQSYQQYGGGGGGGGGYNDIMMSQPQSRAVSAAGTYGGMR